MASQFDAVGVEDGERALRIRARRAAKASEAVDAILAEHSLALNQGRPVLALDLTEQLQELQPGLHAHLRLRVLDALYGGGDTTAARSAAAALGQFTGGEPAPAADTRAVQLADGCVLEQWRLSRGIVQGARQAVAQLRAAAAPRAALPVSANQLACAELLDAMWSVRTRQPNALARVARLDSLMLGGPAVSDAGTYAHLVVARLYEQLGQPRRALEAIRRRAYMTGWPRYLAATRREEARLAALTGDHVGAVRSYEKYLALRPAPEASVRPRDDSVRAALAEARARAR
jgi:hypothetical protein